MSIIADPPLLEQLRPLPIAELQRRCALLHSRAGVPPRDDDDTQPGTKQAALDAATAACERWPRAQRRLRGQPLPSELVNALTKELRQLQWPDKSHRPGLDSESYLVLLNSRQTSRFGTRHPHYTLRKLCDEVVACAAPRFKYTAIAVTKNFTGSPHIDAFDRSRQLAVSLGDFVAGGELCVDEDGAGLESLYPDGGSGGGEQLRHSVAVVDTHNRVASLDGRHVHWVRTFAGGDRFSLIFYNTETEQELGELQTDACASPSDCPESHPI